MTCTSEMSKDKIETKEQQKEHARHLKKMFDKIERDKDLIPVVMQRGAWEALHWTIGRALELQYKKEKK